MSFWLNIAHISLFSYIKRERSVESVKTFFCDILAYFMKLQNKQWNSVKGKALQTAKAQF